MRAHRFLISGILATGLLAPVRYVRMPTASQAINSENIVGNIDSTDSDISLIAVPELPYNHYFRPAEERNRWTMY